MGLYDIHIYCTAFIAKTLRKSFVVQDLEMAIFVTECQDQLRF